MELTRLVRTRLSDSIPLDLTPSSAAIYRRLKCARTRQPQRNRPKCQRKCQLRHSAEFRRRLMTEIGQKRKSRAITWGSGRSAIPKSVPVANPPVNRHHSGRLGGARHGRERPRALNATSQSVFISYASQDADAADRICDAFGQRASKSGSTKASCESGTPGTSRSASRSRSAPYSSRSFQSKVRMYGCNLILDRRY